MSILSIRFRMEGELCVLQVLEQGEHDAYSYGRSTAAWRDAKVTDLLNVATFTSNPEAVERRLSSLQETVSLLQMRAMREIPPEYDTKE